MIPKNVIEFLESELELLTFGNITLEIVVNDGKPKYRIIKTVSVIPDKPASENEKK